MEKALRKDGVDFVEDFEGDTVIVRYGDFMDDAAWEAYNAPPVVVEIPVEEGELVCA